MPLSLTCEQLLERVGGRCAAVQEQLSFEGVEFDSRRIRGGELFIALRGEKTHGHAFVEQAFQRGAALCLVEDAALFAEKVDAARLVQVPNTLEAFGTLAAWWRRELKTPIAAVTGSVGKTMVKELAAALLLQCGRGVYSQKSFNNHVGVPYTLCQLGREHNWAVLELGMNHPGELRYLAGLVQPNVGVITRIAPVHQEFFPTLAAIADAKCELLEGLAQGGRLILNGDDPELLAGVARKEAQLGELSKVYFGRGESAEARVVSVEELGLSGIELQSQSGSEVLDETLHILGRHNAFNLAAALLTARTLLPAFTMEQARTALKRFVPPQMRLNLHWTKRGRIIVDDSYNANPTSMQGMLDLAGTVKRGGQTIAIVLGDMLELGADGERYHREIGRLAAKLKPECLVAVGSFAPIYAECAREGEVPAFIAESPEAAAHIVSKLDSEVVFIKASRGVALDKTVNTLLEVEGEAIPNPQGSNLP